MSLRRILASVGLLKTAKFDEKKIIKILGRDDVPWRAQELWAELQGGFDKDAVGDWLSEGNEENYDWGDVEVVDEHPLWIEISDKFEKEEKELVRVLEDMTERGILKQRSPVSSEDTWTLVPMRSMKITPRNKKIFQFLLDRGNRHSSTKEIWAAIQSGFNWHALNDWLYEGEEPKYEWGDLKNRQEHFLWRRFDEMFARDKSSLEKTLMDMVENGDAVRESKGWLSSLRL